MTKVFGVYTHSRADGAIFYVGKGTHRRAHNLGVFRNPHHQRTLNKVGRDNVIVAFTLCDSEADALAEEVRLIAECKARGIKLCNLTLGGEGCSGYVHTDSTKKWLSEKLKKRPVSEEHRAKIAAGLKGKPKSHEHRMSLRQAHLGKKHSPEHVQKCKDAKRGIQYTAEQKARQREGFDKPEVRQRHRDSLRKYWSCEENRKKHGEAIKRGMESSKRKKSKGLTEELLS